MALKEELISFDTAKLAKEKQFDEVTVNHYCYEPNGNYSLFMDDLKNSEHANNEFTAPTQSLLQKWLREVHNIHIQNHFFDGKYHVKIKYNILSSLSKSENVYKKDTYEQALEEGLQKALKLINHEHT